MVEAHVFRDLALSLPGTEEQPHFEMASFRFKNKIFATLRESDGRAMVQLSLTDQDVFCAFGNNRVFYPVPGGWGKRGSTFVNLAVVGQDMLADALNCAYQNIVQKQSAKKAQK